MVTATDDKGAFRDKSLYFRGRAKVSLDRLHYNGISTRGDVSEKHVSHLVKVFRAEGCSRLHDPNHYVPAIVSSDDLDGALSSSNLRLLDLMQDREPPFLNFREGTRIRVLHGEHRLRAAQQFLEPTERWWTVVIYTTELSETSQKIIREEYSHQLRFTDGDIYRNIRSCEMVQDWVLAKKWRVRLTPRKTKNLNRLGRDPYKGLQSAFDDNIPFIGLWDSFHLGSFNRIIPMKCSEELEHYVRHIYETWKFICHEPELFNLVDSSTVKHLETLTPEATADRNIIQALAHNGEIFSNIDRPTVLGDIMPRLLQIKGRIPSFHTFFEDTIYMEALVKSLRPLLPPSPSLPANPKPSFRQLYYHCFTDVGQQPNMIKIETGECSFRLALGSTVQRKELGYLMMFLAAMRNFSVLSQTAPHQSQGGKKPSVEGSIKERLTYLALLALDLGFDSPEIQTFAKDNPDLAAAREFIHRYRPSDQYALDTERAEALARHLAVGLRAIASPLNQRSSPIFSGYERVPKKLRCGVPDDISHKKDRKILYLDSINSYNPPFEQHLTTLAFQRDIFVCFFGTHTIPVETSQTISHDGSGSDSVSHIDSNNWEYSRADGSEIESPGDIDTSYLDDPANPLRRPLIHRTSGTGSSNYDIRSTTEAPSRPVSQFSNYLRSIEAAIWPHNEMSQNVATEDEIAPLAPGFERTTSLEMNKFHTLNDRITPSEAVVKFLEGSPVIVVYLWSERQYIKFWPTQRWVFEDAMSTLADCNMCFAVFEGNDAVVTGLANIWNEAPEAKLVLAGHRSTALRPHDAARPLDDFLRKIDEI